ncbi:hypothetical protein ACCO45_010414 [Purpureocillium lilacinum]|uniref:Uncharacterized protein n=1 Tax=Purpureocillium lilacinum TaxID=33203 RepID=A0ACC4DHE7_PURLI
MRHILISFLLARGLASANQLAQAAGGITIGIPLPTPTEAPPPLADRAQPADHGPGLRAAQLGHAERPHRGCTLTMPASLSKAYSSYVDVLQTYFSTLSSKAQCLRKCGASRLSVTVTATCKESLTLVFTGGVGRRRRRR